MTRADLEKELIGRYKGFMAKCRLNISTMDGTNPDLEGIIRDAVDAVGGTDGDPATVGVSMRTIMRPAGIFLLEKCIGNWAEWDQKSGMTDQKLSQLADQMRDEIKAIQEELADPEQAGIVVIDPPPDAGIIRAGTYIPHDPFRGLRGDRFPY